MSLSWKEFHEAEKAYLQVTKRHGDHNTLKIDFLGKQKIFDKLLKKKKRSFQRSEVHNLDKANTSNPVAFWKHIWSLGLRGSSTIPMEVYDDKGNIVEEDGAVLNKWKTDFEGLLKTPTDQTPEQRHCKWPRVSTAGLAR